MENETLFNMPDTASLTKQKIVTSGNRIYIQPAAKKLPEILCISSHPPRECGIATYSQDLIKSLQQKFGQSFTLSICALENDNEIHVYPKEVKYVLHTDRSADFIKLAHAINESAEIATVLLQHEFGFFAKNPPFLTQFLTLLRKPVITVFHTVLPHPNEALQANVKGIATLSRSVIVMTHSSAEILKRDYAVPASKITVIPHGTHLVPHPDKDILKAIYGLSGRKILSTFGLLSSGKSIETTLEALPAIVKNNPDVLFLIIGKTHPSVVKQEGEQYRRLLEEKVAALAMEEHVLFINQFLPLPTLLDYLQLTDVYLFTSQDPNQAVSGTFSYAISCGCPIVSTPIPHALEVLKDDAGIIIGFRHPEQLSAAVIRLLDSEALQNRISSTGLQKMAATSWQNSAIAHARTFQQISGERITLKYSLPEIRLDHLKKMTTEIGIIQFSQINQPDISTGYTLDDNARALIAICQHFELTGDPEDLGYMTRYLAFIQYCLQPEGYFLNYVDEDRVFTDQNFTTNLADSNGRAIWALGFLLSLESILPENMINAAEQTMQIALLNVNSIHSTRALAFVIKGLYYKDLHKPKAATIALIKHLANRLVQMYRHEADENWCWFESYLTYANSILPEAMLCAWLATGDSTYRQVANSSFDFLLSKIFQNGHIRVISNKTWLHKEKEAVYVTPGGEQPIDVAYTILALSRFYDAYGDKKYLTLMEIACNWFLGDNHLHQIIYNPCTGGCYDGLEEKNVNLNQGSESTVSYLMARLTLEKALKKQPKKSFIQSYQEAIILLTEKVK